MATNEKIEYGLPQAFIIVINNDGSYTNQTVTASSYSGNVLTVGTALTVAQVGEPVVFHLAGENSYGFGKVLTSTTVELDESSRDYFITNGASLKFYKGMGVADFSDASISASQTGVTYKGAYKFDRASDYTDAEATLTLTDCVLTDAFVELLSGNKSLNFGGGKAMSMGDFDVYADKEIKPVDVSVIAIKRRTDNADKWEEFVLHRANTGDFSTAFNKDSYFTTTYTFNGMTKSSANQDVLDYNVEV